MFIYATSLLKDGRDIVDVMQLVVIPVVLVALPLIVNRQKQTAILAREAAESVRPNGTGHKSLVHMSEDILLLLGEQKGEVRDLKDSFYNHIHQDYEFMEEITASLEEIKDTINTVQSDLDLVEANMQHLESLQSSLTYLE